MKHRPEPEHRHGTDERVGVLLVNLGTPDAPTAPALRRYLAEFLSDPRVVEIPRAAWLPILHGIVLRTRPVESVVLPRSVVTLSGDGDLGIRAVDAQDKVTFHPIDLVDDTPEGLVLGGIPADARIIVQGQEFVTEGETVKAVAADEKALKELAGEAAGETN